MVAAPTSNNQTPVRPPALIEATQRSTAAWQSDLQTLFHRAKDRFPDVVWELNDEDPMDRPNVSDSHSEEVYGHKAIVYARAPPSFQARYFTFRPGNASSPTPYAASPTLSLPMPTTSALSLNLGIDVPYDQSLRSVSPSQFRTNSPVPSILGSLTRIPLSEKTALFSNELEYLYTGKGFGEAFDFLFESSMDEKPDKTTSDTNNEETRMDKLRKDLVFMWRSRLYSDVKIELIGDSTSPSPISEEETVPVFWSHRFVLASRSPYFYDQLITYGLKNAPAPGEPAKVRIPSPPFTPPALHFALGYLYSGTLNFSNRSYDLDTAFAILLSANYLQLQNLYDEVQARLVQEMLHGLFHAFLEFAEYERITGGRWGTGGCRCRQCARRAPRVLLFSVRPEVQNAYLERGARRALVGLFGEGWCTSEFSTLPQKTKDGLMKGLAKRTTPMNVFALLFASHAALKRLASIRDAWADGVRDMVNAGRTTIDAALCNEAEKCFNEPDWVEIMENDGLGRFEDGERVEWTMDSVKRGITESNAGMLYQALVSAILLRPHPTEPNETLLSNNSPIRAQIEQARMDVIRWMRKRWVGIRQENGFSQLESWAVKEIAHEIDVAYDDLMGSNGAHMRGPPTRTGLRPTLSKVEDLSERDSTYSLRASLLSKNAGRGSAQPVLSSGASIRSTSRSIISNATHASRASRLTTSTTATERARKESRPDSKFSPSYMRSVSPALQTPPTPIPTSPQRITASNSRSSSSMDLDGGAGDVDGADADADELGVTAALAAQAASTASSRRSGASSRMLRAPPVKESDSASIRSNHERTIVTIQRPKSVAPSVSSVRTQREREPSSSVKRSGTSSGTSASRGTTPSESRPASTVPSLTVPARPESRTGTRSSAKEKDKENGGSASRGRKVSTASTISVSGRSTTSRSPRVSAPSLPNNANENKSGGSAGSTRPRRLSEASGTVTARQSVVVSRTRKLSAASTTATTVTGERPKTLVVRRTPSSTSVKSSVSSASISSTSAAAGKRSEKSSPTEERKPVQALSMKKSASSSSAASNNKPLPRKPSSMSMASEGGGGSPTAGKDGERERRETTSTHRPQSRISQSDNGSTTTRATLRHKESQETIRLKQAAGASSDKPAQSDVRAAASETKTEQAAVKEPRAQQQQQRQLPRGATLEVGIPCIVHSKRKKFRAYARYIGEVEGERGPWVGIEVPIVGDGWWGAIDRVDPNGDPASQQDEDGRVWHDGTWGGIRYFELGGSSTGEQDNAFNDFYDERERSLRRRAAAAGGGSSGFGGPWFGGGFGYGSFGARSRTLKRGGDDQLSFDERQKRFRSASPNGSDMSGAEYRGLFVRPQQVLYVVDAVGAD